MAQSRVGSATNVLLCVLVWSCVHMLTAALPDEPQWNLTPLGAARRAAAETAHAVLRRQQLEGDCASKRYLVMQWSEEDKINGFAAMFQFVASSLAVATMLNRTLTELLPPPPYPTAAASSSSGSSNTVSLEALSAASAPEYDPWLRAPAGACNGLKYGCYFQPYYSCAVTAAAAASGTAAGAAAGISSIPLLDPTGAPQQEQVVRINSLAVYHELILRASRGAAAPPAFAAAAGGTCAEAPAVCTHRLWFPALVSFLFKPLPRVQARAQQAVSQLRAAAAAAAGGGGHPSYGLHHRQGDAAKLGWRAPDGLSSYITRVKAHLQHLQRISGGGGGDDGGAVLYVATDSVSSRAAAAAAAAPELALAPSAASILRATDPATGQAADVHIHIESYLAAQLAKLPQPAPAVAPAAAVPMHESVTAAAAAAAPVHTNSDSNSDSHSHSAVSSSSILVLHSGGETRELRTATATPGATTAGAGAGAGAVRVVPFDPSQYAALPPSPATVTITGTAAAGDTAAAAAAAEYMAAASLTRSLTDGVVADIWALSHAQYLIGTCLSQVSRTAAELAYAGGYLLAAPVGIDAGGCRALGRHFYSIPLDWRADFDVWADE